MPCALGKSRAWHNAVRNRSCCILSAEFISREVIECYCLSFMGNNYKVATGSNQNRQLARKEKEGRGGGDKGEGGEEGQGRSLKLGFDCIAIRAN